MDAALALAGARLTDPQRHGRKRNREGQQPKRDICAAPAEPVDQDACELRDDKRSEPDPGHRDAQCQPAPAVEPRRDRLGIAERRLDRAGHAGERHQQCEYRQRVRREAQQAQKHGVDDEAGERYLADPPAVHQIAEHRHRQCRGDMAGRQCRRGDTAVPAHIRHDRLQKHAKGKAEHRAVADKEPGHRSDHHPPRVGKSDLHRVPSSGKSSIRCRPELTKDRDRAEIASMILYRDAARCEPVCSSHSLGVRVDAFSYTQLLRIIAGHY